MTTEHNFYTLNNGVQIPVIGFGTFLIEDKDVTDLVLNAFEVGYRHIDTAYYYNNEKGIGKAIKHSGLKREEIFITSKLWMDDLGYDKTVEAFEKTMDHLKLDYIDLYLIHWPRPLALESWKALEKFYAEKRVRAIGVCNYNQNHLEDLLKIANVVPVINQIELHPKLQQEKLREFCKEKGIVVEAWSPIMKGQVTQMDVLVKIGKKHGKSPAQVALRWHIQNDVVVIPKTERLSRMVENSDIFDFQLSQEEMFDIKQLNENIRVGADPKIIYSKGYNK